MTIIGSTNVDMICQLDHLPAMGETVVGGTFMQTYGGKGANQAVAAARAGGEVTFVTSLGDDNYAPLCLDNFRRDGIDVSGVICRKGVSTGVALVMFDQQGRNYLAIASGANHAITPTDIENCKEQIAESALVIMQNEISPDAALRAIDIATHARVPILLNYAPVGNTPIPVSSRVQCLVVNENEAAQLSGQDVRTAEQVKAAARILKEMGPAVVIITLGAEGSYVLHGQHELVVPAHKVKVVDTTAAGDTFCGVLGVALLEGMDWLESTRFATAASAISVTRMGAQPSIPTRAEIDRFMKEHHG